MTTEKQQEYALLIGRILFTFGLVASIFFVFGNSMEVAEVSSEASGTLLAKVQAFFTTLGMSDFAAQITETLIRKIAHVCEYMLVGFFMMLCLRVYTKRFMRHVTWPMFGGLFVALIDETIQLFSEGRSSSVTDIWIDFFGVMLGLSIALFLLCLWRMGWILYRNRDL